MNIRASWQDKNIVNTIVDHLRSNLVVASASDTVIGLLAPLTQHGFDALNVLKGRDNKPYLILLNNSAQANLFTDTIHEKRIKQLIKNFWPGPLTIIVPAKKSIPHYMKSQKGAIALRVPNHAGLQAVAKQMNGIFSTSANRADMPTPQIFDDLDPEIAKSVALIVGNHHCTTSKPSTILDCTDNQIRIVREGVYSENQLRSYMNK